MPNSNAINSSESTDNIDDESCTIFTLEPKPNLMFLPDDCLIAIMKYLGPVELNVLSKISERINHLASNNSLWKNIDFRPHKLSSSHLKEYEKYFNHSTTFIAVQGFACGCYRGQWRRSVITPRLLDMLTSKCIELETLIMEAVSFELTISNFPSTLRYLSLKESIVIGSDNRLHYFQGIHNVMPHLKVLILSNCQWVASHDFMAISKCNNLEELRLDGCRQLGDSVAYISLAARFGFQSLKILDLRNTSMGDSDVSSFSHTLTLEELYLEKSLSPISKVCNNKCDASCTDMLVDVDFTETSDTIKLKKSSVVPSSAASSWMCFFSSPDCTRNSPSSSHQSNKIEYKDGHISPPKISNNEKEAVNGDTSVADISTSHGNLVHLKSGSSHLEISQNHRGMRKRRSSASKSSSDNYQSNGKHTDISNTLDSVSQSVNESSHKNIVSANEIECNTKSKRQCNETDNILINDEVPGCSNNEQQMIDSSSSNPIVDASTIPNSSSDCNNRDFRKTFSFTSHIQFQTTPVSSSSNNERYNLTFYNITDESIISDTCVMSFVLNENEDERLGYIRIISSQGLNARPQLRTLVLRNYRMITDTSLQYLLRLSSLRYLDVSGTSVTEDGVLQFILKRPEVNIVSDFHDLV
ncbi:hypothetical protein L9F63_009511 [Diploptera punctata]|uniref:F-box domain-containing protein n=1 Tax=Diploptera punctata TaxID=6984 RepID=A0AAD8ESK1_DIPPU|nr:hypothetical protein L9F63_009511 [Diploptera punctata]